VEEGKNLEIGGKNKRGKQKATREVRGERLWEKVISSNEAKGNSATPCEKK